jgi:UDP-glucose 4-epimerase
MLTPKRIILLGNKGFVGSQLETSLRELAPEYIGFHLGNLDLTLSAAPLVDLFDQQTTVVMTAGVKRQKGDSLEAFSQNLAMAVNVAKVLETRPVQRFIYFSSAAVYGETIHNEAISEETPIRPTSYYGAAKFASECVLRDCVALRPPLIYGAGDTTKSYGPSGFAYAAKHGEPATLWGEGDEKREFIYVDDVVKLVARLISHPFLGPLNLASGQSYTFLEAATLAGAVIQNKPRSKPKVDHQFLNQRLTGLFPDFIFRSLSEGMNETLSAL